MGESSTRVVLFAQGYLIMRKNMQTPYSTSGFETDYGCGEAVDPFAVASGTPFK